MWQYPKVADRLWKEFPHYDYGNWEGGRGRGGTELFGRIAARAMLELEMNVLIGRYSQTSVKQSTINLIKRIIRESEYAKHFDLRRDTIIRCKKTGTRCEFKGIHYQIEDWRSIDDFGLVWWEEPQQATDYELDVVLPSLRAGDQVMLASWNRERPDSPIQRLTKLPNSVSVFSTYKDNPFFPPRLEALRLHDLEHRPREIYEWKWDGAYRPIAEGNPFGLENIRNAVKRAPLPIPYGTEEDTVVGVDPAYSSDGDFTALVKCDSAGNIIAYEQWRQPDQVKKSAAVIQFCKGATYIKVDITREGSKDSVGPLVEDLREAGLPAYPVYFSTPVKKQLVRGAADRLSNGKVAFKGCSPTLLQDQWELYGENEKSQFAATYGYDDIVTAWMLAVDALDEWGY